MPEKVLVTREIPSAGLRALEPFDVRILHERPPERGELLDAVRGVSGVLSTATEKVDGELMDAAGEDLRVVANMAVGYDNVDVEAATERGLVVTNTPGVLDETTADVAFMLLLATARRLGEGERLLRAGRWEWWRPKQLMGRDVWGNEPEVHPKLLELETVAPAPRIGTASISTREKMAALAAESLPAVLRG